MREMDAYVRKITEEGYTNADGAPLKCLHCESKDFKDDFIYEDYYMVEHLVTCRSCGNVTGHWSYGTWEVM